MSLFCTACVNVRDHGSSQGYPHTCAESGAPLAAEAHAAGATTATLERPTTDVHLAFKVLGDAEAADLIVLDLVEQLLDRHGVQMPISFTTRVRT